MMKKTAALLVIAISTMIGGFMQSVRAEHSGGDVTFIDYSNKSITIGTSVPYSPKQTCAPNSAGGCHKSYVDFFGLDNIYESHIGQARKDHGPGTASYLVPYPQHGVTAGYHQMGRNMTWGDIQRNYYGLFAFTSSSGMYGKYCPPSDRQLTHPAEQDPSRFDMSSYDFAHSECAWCHPGGGSLEYDRAGYRYDGVYSGLLGTAGFNPRLPNDIKGDYFTYVQGVGLESRAAAWADGGVVEFDCFICHYSRQYANVERNWGIAEKPVLTAAYSSPNLAPSLGLVGVKGAAGLLTIGQKAAAGTNPTIDPAQWKWNTEITNQFNFAKISKTSFNRIPATENCAICHFEDGSWTELGPAGVSLGSTVFQKRMPAGSAVDSDETGANGTDRLNDVPWNYAKKRAEYGKRIGSINDPLQNPDVHMDRGMNCVDCHYIIEDTFGAVYDASDNEVLPEVTIFRIDHMFAKGNNSPDGRNMDQIANTVTCESCHITGAHPRVDKTQPDGKWYLSGTSKVIKIPTHTGFPSFHFGRIDCRACHIPELRTDVKENVIDHTAGTYRGYERTQVSTGGGGGIVYRPLYTPRLREKGVVRILPTITMTSAVWVDGSEDKPAFQRLAAQSAEAYRLFRGDADSNGVYDWPLNRAQNSDTALIVNKADEIAWMVGNLKALGVGEPVMNLYVNAFTVSHNVVPTVSGKILGAPEGGVCLMCHASDDRNNIYYSKYAVGFFDKKHVLFDQPQDGGSGLVQTVVNDASGNPLKRVKMQFKTSDVKGGPFVIDIAGSTPAGGTVPNTLDQRKAMGYDSAYLASLIAPGTAGVEMPSAYFIVNADAVVSRKMNFDGSFSTCRPSTATCTFTWDFGGAGTPDLADPMRPAFIYDAVGQYRVKLIVSNEGTQGVHSADVTARNVSLKPVVAYTMTLSGMTVTLVDSSTDDDVPLKVKVVWGNGTAISGAGGATFTKTYKYAGQYTINYTVTDATGTQSTKTEVVAIPQ
ncbi:MAG: hypothetical protein A2072_01705 [Nitrospirae bacterium GWC1_57_7]|nr:MAG: hypothetical protein A2072_01705 [Nitrospirae bacterium GWC1_57_7]